MATPPFLPDETKPADSDIVSQFPAVERLFRDIIETWLLVDHDTSGQHKQVTLPESAGDPTPATDIGFVYTKNDGGDTELFYEDAGGNVVQITLGGAINVFPANTSMLFYQSAAPTGWTKDTAATLNDHAIRVVTSTGWTTGSNGTNAFSAVLGSSPTAGGHQLTEAEIPAHTHTTPATANFAGSGGTKNPGTSTGAMSNTSDATGGDGTHTHTMDLNFINVIRATKD